MQTAGVLAGLPPRRAAARAAVGLRASGGPGLACFQHLRLAAPCGRRGRVGCAEPAPRRGRQGVVPAVTSELFGLQHFATNYALTQLGPAAGARPRPGHMQRKELHASRLPLCVAELPLQLGQRPAAPVPVDPTMLSLPLQVAHSDSGRPSSVTRACGQASGTGGPSCGQSGRLVGARMLCIR